MKKVKLLFSKLLSIFKSKKEKLEQKVSYLSSVSQMPFIVKVENTTEQTIKNVSLFFANSQNELAFSSDGSYRENGLIISSGVPNVRYNHISKSFVTNKTDILFTYLQSENNKQILSKFTIKQQDANGLSATKVVTPKLDPYQQHSNIVAVKEKYRLDGDTSFIIHELLPNTTLKIYFYPEFKIDNLKQL